MPQPQRLALKKSVPAVWQQRVVLMRSKQLVWQLRHGWLNWRGNFAVCAVSSSFHSPRFQLVRLASLCEICAATNPRKAGCKKIL